jgi:lipopolysaccharide transport system ATP-binding protein
LFVSHDMTAIKALCQRVMLLEGGRITLDGDPDDTVTRYLDGAAPADAVEDRVELANVEGRLGNGSIRFTCWSVVDGTTGSRGRVGCNRACTFELDYELGDRNEARNVSVMLIIQDQFGRPVTATATRFVDADFASVPQRGQFRCTVPKLFLLPGAYRLHIWCRIGGELADRILNAGAFEVTPEDVFGTGKNPTPNKHGVVVAEHQVWTLESK